MLAAALVGLAVAEEPATVDAFGAAVDRMLAAIARVDEATFVLHQQEYVNGSLHDPVVMRVRYRAPNTAYVEWNLENPQGGQRLLWIPGDNGDRMRVDPGPFLPNVSLSPESGLATRGQRHTIRRLGLQPVAELFRADAARIAADRPRLSPTGVSVRDDTLYGRAARCYVATMRKDLEPALYATKAEVCVDAASLPLRMTLWDLEDGALRMIEQYGYEGLDTHPGFGADAFDPAALGF